MVKKKANALRSNSRRTIRRSFPRFVSLMVMGMLGVFVFSGLMATAPDMIQTLDSYLDNYQIYDIRIICDMGLEDADLTFLTETDGVEYAEAGWSVDSMAFWTGAEQEEETVINISSLPEKLNMLELVEGRLPVNDSEIVVEENMLTQKNLELGDHLILGSDSVKNDRVTIVGTVKSALYYNSTGIGQNRGNTSIGSGTINYYTYMKGTAFDLDCYTVIYLLVRGAAQEITSEKPYTGLVEEVYDKLEDLKSGREAARYQSLYDKANSEIEEARGEADQELADAWTELEDARLELENGWNQISDGGLTLEDARIQLADAWKVLEESRLKLTQTSESLVQGKSQLDNTKSQLDDAYTQITDNETVLSAGKEELDAGKTALDQAESQLAAVKEELDSAAEELESARQEYALALEQAGITEEDIPQLIEQAETGIASCEEGISQLEQALSPIREKLAACQDSSGQLQSSVETLNAQIAEVNSTIASLESQKAATGQASDSLPEGEGEKSNSETDDSQIQSQLEECGEKLEELQNLRQDLLNQMAELQETENTLEAQLGPYNTQKAALESQRDGISETLLQLNNLKTAAETIAQGTAAYEEKYALYEAGLESWQAETEQYESKMASYQAADSALQDAKSTYELGYSQYQSGLSSYQSARTRYEEGTQAYQDGLGEYEEGLREYRAGQADYRTSMKIWEKGQNEYENGVSEYESAKAEADRRIADAREELENLKQPTWYIYDRSGYSTYTDYVDDSNSISNLATLFPVVFFAVAVLVSLISMNRMVEEDRLEIGTLKSLGFDNRMIMSKYLNFSLLATVVGGIIGCVLGLVIIPEMIFNIYGILFDLPPLTLTLQPASTLLGFALTVLCVCGSSVWTALQVLKEKPSELMRPKAPKNGKRILLEQIPGLWRRFSFSRKVTIRNIFRYKKRVMVTIGGIAGCTALMLTGFGIKDSIVDIPSLQYYNIYQFDGTAYVTSFGTELAEEDFLQKKSIRECTTAQRKNAVIEGVDGFLQVVENDSELRKIADFHDSENGELLHLIDGKAIINEKLSAMTGLRAGDMIELVDVDNNRIQLEICGVATNYIEHFVYISQATYEGMGYVYTPNLVYFQMNDTSEAEKDRLAEELLESEQILSVSFRSSLISNVGNTLKSLDQVVLILIVLAALLAFVVLYNLSNININERKREIATLKVLGFYDKEVDNYISRETVILTVAGIVIGLWAGNVLCHMVVNTIEIEKCRFVNEIKPMSYFYAAAMSGLFTWIVNLITHFNLKRINMIDSLKSVE